MSKLKNLPLSRRLAILLFKRKVTMEIKCKYSEIVSLEKLVENPRNDNKHKQEHAELLAKVMKVRGIRHPIIVSKRSGFIVAGHLRLSAAKILGLNEFPIDLQDFENEADEYAFLTSDNNVARYAEIDQEKFKLNLEELDFNLEEVDFGEFGLLDFEIPNFDPSGEDDQGKLDEIEMEILECPSCGEHFEKKQAKVVT